MENEQNQNLDTNLPPTQTTAPASQGEAVRSQTIAEPKPKLPKWIIVAIVAGILIVGGASAYILNKNSASKALPSPTPMATINTTPTPTPDPTANWKTYVNTKVGFQIKYPDRYPQPQLPSGAPGGPTLYVTGNEDDNDIIFGSESNDSLYLSVFPFSGTVDDLKLSDRVSFTGYNKTFIKNTKVDGTTAQWYKITPKIVYPETQNEANIKVIFVGKNHGFKLDSGGINFINYSTSEMEQMLSTFKFIAPIPSPTADATTNWQSYSSSNFSVKYPPAWFVNEYADNNPSVVEISDVKNSSTAIIGMSDTHTRIQVSYISGAMPSCFPYGNGGTGCVNSTIKAFSINSYSGISGQQSTAAGLEDVVYLKSPNGNGYVFLGLFSPQKNGLVAKDIYDKLLLTFKFTN